MYIIPGVGINGRIKRIITRRDVLTSEFVSANMYRFIMTSKIEAQQVHLHGMRAYFTYENAGFTAIFFARVCCYVSF